MDTLKINTFQNIDIEQPIASVGERVVATIIDVIIISTYMTILALVTLNIKNQSLMAIGSLPVIFYGLLSEVLMNGQTWGKKVLKIKVIKIDGTVTTFTNYFLRWIVSLIEIYVTFGSLALITIIINRKGQRLGDIAANTSIIRLDNKAPKKPLIIQVPENYTVVFAETIKLTTSDIYTIEEVLEFLRSPKYDVPKTPFANKAREAIETKLNIKSTQNNMDFFQTILNDYNYLNSKNI
jgi:uncharacterized RDD family membrane protein YckC